MPISVAGSSEGESRRPKRPLKKKAQTDSNKKVAPSKKIPIPVQPVAVPAKIAPKAKTVPRPQPDPVKNPKQPIIPMPDSELENYEPDPFVSCVTRACGIPGEPGLYAIEVTCTLCEAKWHEPCVEKTGDRAAEPELFDEWCCPECIHVCGGRWDKEMCVRPSYLPLLCSD